MYCPECGNELREHSHFCDKCGCKLKEYQEIDEKEKWNKKRNKGKMLFLGSVLCIVLAVVVGKWIYERNNETEQSKRQSKVDVENLTVFTNERKREPIDPMKYGKDTPEEVIVEMVQGICDDDVERFIHVILPDLLNDLMQIPPEIDKEANYSEYLSYIESVFEKEDIFTKFDTWECHIIKKESWSEEEIKQINERYKNNGYDNTEIIDGMTITIRLDAEVQENAERGEEMVACLCKTQGGKWFAVE